MSSPAAANAQKQEDAALSGALLAVDDAIAKLASVGFAEGLPPHDEMVRVLRHFFGAHESPEDRAKLAAAVLEFHAGLLEPEPKSEILPLSRTIPEPKSEILPLSRALPEPKSEILPLSRALPEPKSEILRDTGNRWTLFPIKYPDVWEAYKTAQRSFWTVDEITCLSTDVAHWTAPKLLTDKERGFLSAVLAFFAASDGIVMENLACRFFEDVPNAEVRAFYAQQLNIEGIHSEMYSVLIDTLIKDEAERERLFNAIHHVRGIGDKARWAQRWIADKGAPFARRLFAFAIVEGVFFSGSFASIFWLRERGIMPGLLLSNELIARDEGQHTDFAVLLHSHLHPDERVSEADAHAIVRDAVDVETGFFNEAMPDDLLNMNAEFMSTYIRFVADRLLEQFGFAKIYNARNPFPFMDRSSLTAKSNFFEKRVSEYMRPPNANQPPPEVKVDIDF